MMHHTMSMYANKDQMIEAMQSEIDLLADNNIMTCRIIKALKQELEAARNRNKNLEAELAELRKEHSQYKKIYENIHAIIDETDGVSGYHLNGEIADWDEFIDDLLLKTTQ